MSSKKIADFAVSDKRWMVAVRMVSEGVDVPRLAVGVYATTTSTPLFFSQAVGRFVRARARGETASIFLPSVPSLLGYAAELELARDHVLGRRIKDESDIFAAENELLARAQAGEGALEEGLPFEALGSEARFDHVLFDGAMFGHEGDVHVGSDEEMDFLGIPGLLEPGSDARAAPAAAGQAAAYGQTGEPDSVAELTTHEQLAVLRRELNGLVAAWHHRTGQAHGVTHAELRRECGGPGGGGRQRHPAARPDRPGARVGGDPPVVLVPNLRPTVGAGLRLRSRTARSGSMSRCWCAGRRPWSARSRRAEAPRRSPRRRAAAGRGTR